MALALTGRRVLAILWHYGLLALHPGVLHGVLALVLAVPHGVLTLHPTLLPGILAQAWLLVLAILLHHELLAPAHLLILPVLRHHGILALALTRLLVLSILLHHGLAAMRADLALARLRLLAILRHLSGNWARYYLLIFCHLSACGASIIFWHGKGRHNKNACRNQCHQVFDIFHCAIPPQDQLFI